MFWVIEKVLAAISLLLIVGAIVAGYIWIGRIMQARPEDPEDQEKDDEWEEIDDE